MAKNNQDLESEIETQKKLVEALQVNVDEINARDSDYNDIPKEYKSRIIDIGHDNFDRHVTNNGMAGSLTTPYNFGKDFTGSYFSKLSRYAKVQSVVEEVEKSLQRYNEERVSATISFNGLASEADALANRQRNRVVDDKDFVDVGSEIKSIEEQQKQKKQRRTELWKTIKR